MRRAVAALVLLALVVTVAVVAQETKVVVLRTAKFTELQHYMYDSVAKTLSTVNTSYVEVLDYELRDKVLTDSYMPCVVLAIDPPSRDLNTNESVVYAWVLSQTIGSAVIVAVADVYGSTVASMLFHKVSPVSGDVAVARTNYDVVIVSGSYKLSIPLSGFANPMVLVMTDAPSLVVTGLSYLELRALTNPPSGYSLIRNGNGEQMFTISASGRLYVWFDETHEGGDVDIFVFDQSHPRYSAVSTSSSWSELVNAYTQDAVHSTYIFADSGPGYSQLTATGTVKFIVKCYSGNCAAVQWRVAAMLDTRTTVQPQPQPPPGTTTTAQPQPTPGTATGLIGTIQTALSNQSTLLVLLGILLLLVIVLALRK